MGYNINDMALGVDAIVRPLPWIKGSILKLLCIRNIAKTRQQFGFFKQEHVLPTPYFIRIIGTERFIPDLVKNVFVETYLVNALLVNLYWAGIGQYFMECLFGGFVKSIKLWNAPANRTGLRRRNHKA